MAAKQAYKDSARIRTRADRVRIHDSSGRHGLDPQPFQPSTRSQKCFASQSVFW